MLVSSLTSNGKVRISVGDHVARTHPRNLRAGFTRIQRRRSRCRNVPARRIGRASSSSRNSATVWHLPAIRLSDEDRRNGPRGQSSTPSVHRTPPMTIDINPTGYNGQHELSQPGFLGKSSLAARELAKSLGKGEQSLKIAAFHSIPQAWRKTWRGRELRRPGGRPKRRVGHTAPALGRSPDRDSIG